MPHALYVSFHIFSTILGGEPHYYPCFINEENTEARKLKYLLRVTQHQVAELGFGPTQPDS